MTEIDYLKCKLEDTEKAFDKLHKRHIELLKQQGKLEKENEQLEQKIKDKNTYQRVLEAKIRRLKNRIKILEKAEGWQN